jgi:hypothetical protein
VLLTLLCLLLLLLFLLLLLNAVDKTEVQMITNAAEASQWY